MPLIDKESAPVWSHGKGCSRWRDNALTVASLVNRTQRQQIIPRPLLGRVTSAVRLLFLAVDPRGVVIAGSLTAALGDPAARLPRRGRHRRRHRRRGLAGRPATRPARGSRSANISPEGACPGAQPLWIVVVWLFIPNGCRSLGHDRQRTQSRRLVRCPATAAAKAQGVVACAIRV